MSIDFSPSIKPYSNQGAFRFWCQTVLPLVYDDSLSYYELLNKVVNYLNNVISDVSNMGDNVDGLSDAYNQLQAYVNGYFDNLDVTQEINNKLDEMASDGTLTEMVLNAIDIPGVISDWLTEHVTPTTPIVDNTLTVSGAAADSLTVGRKFKETGYRIKGVKGDVGVISEPSKNLVPGDMVNLDIASGEVMSLSLNLEPGTYTISAVVTTNSPDNKCFYAIYREGANPALFPTSERIAMGTINTGNRNASTFTVPAGTKATRMILGTAATSGASANYSGTWRDVQIEKGSYNSIFKPPFSAIDTTARKEIALSNLKTDLISEQTKNLVPVDLVNAIIDTPYGEKRSIYLDLEPGTYTISAIVKSTSAASSCYYAVYREGTNPELWPSGERIAYGTVTKQEGVRTSSTFTISERAKRITLCSGNTFSDSIGNTGTWKDVQIEKGTVATDFILPYIAVDAVARDAISNIDFTKDITHISDTFTKVGITFEKINEKRMRIYGTSTSSGYRNITFTMGEQQEVWSSVTPVKTYPAGKYKVHYEFSGYAANSYVNIIRTDGNITPTLPSDGVIDMDVPFTIAIRVESRKNFGTNANATVLDLDIQAINNGTDLTVLASTNDNTDRTADILATLYCYGVCTLSKGIFVISPFVMPKNTQLCGVGNGARIVCNNTKTGSFIKPKEGCKIKDLEIMYGGSGEEIPTTYAVADGIAYVGTGNKNIVIDNCYIHGFNGAGIKCAETGTGVHSMVVSNCFIKWCYWGIFTQNSEFIEFNNCQLTRNRVGLLNRGGNNKFCNCGFDGNIVNCLINNDSGSNNGQGAMVGCTFEHSEDNNNYNLHLKGTGRMVFSGCHFSHGFVRVENTDGNIFSGCAFGGLTPIEIVGGKATIWVGCMFKAAADNPVTINNNTAYKFNNCYYRSGTAFAP